MLLIPIRNNVRSIDPTVLDAQEEEAAKLAEAGAPGPAIVGTTDQMTGDAEDQEELDEPAPTPKPGKKSLPVVPPLVDVTEYDAIKALEVWDAAMPEYKGLLGAEQDE